MLGRSYGAVRGPAERATELKRAAEEAAAKKAAEEAAEATAKWQAAEQTVKDITFPTPFSGDIKSYNDIVKIGCKYRKYLSSIMQNTNVSVDEEKKQKLILHVRSILYCYIVNIGFTKDNGLKFFNRAKAFFENGKNEEKLKKMAFDGPKYKELLDGDVYGEKDTFSSAYYPKILAGDGKGYEVGEELVDANGEIKKEGDTGSGALGGKVSRVGKKKRTTKKKGTTKKRKVKRRKYSLKR
jgi:hypothetical protein